MQGSQSEVLMQLIHQIYKAVFVDHNKGAVILDDESLLRLARCASDHLNG